jgi:Cu(I)/Ag(I) efflux system membrane fusion protein
MNKIKLLLSLMVAILIVSAGSYRLGKRSSGVTALASSDAPKVARKILYYRNPMGLPDTSPVPKKDAMGMDYVPVYDGDEVQEGGAVNISVEKVQKLGVKSESATLRSLNKTIQATGRVVIDERRTYTIAPKFEGWVERLYVNSTGETVSRGQALFDVYSPELVSAQREYALAVQGETKLEKADEETKAGMKQLAEASLARLKNWDMTPGEIKQLSAGKSRRTLTYFAPVSGIVLEKKAVQGMRFMPGEALYQIADLSSVWVLADISEQDIGQVRTGGEVQVNIDAYPDKSFKGRINFVYPTMNSATRTVPVRVEIANLQGLLKPSMFAKVTLPVGSNTQVLTVPASAVIDSGTRQLVLVQLAQGRFEPRTVKLGNRSNDYVEIRNGLLEGEQVVTSALFLIDAESNLKAALAGMSVAASPADVGRDLSRQVGLKPDLPIKVVGHHATGILNTINSDGTVSITHQPIQSLGWPGMTMDFALTNAALVTGIKPGSKISFELVERKPDEWVINSLHAQHEGH